MSCRWVWNDYYEVWQTGCGCELIDEDVDTVQSLDATHCPWCGQRFELDESDAGSVRREEERALRRDYYEAVMPR